MDHGFEQNYYSGTAKVIQRIRHDCIRLMRGIAYYDKYSEIMNYYDLL